jgi:hypothetical protein
VLCTASFATQSAGACVILSCARFSGAAAKQRPCLVCIWYEGSVLWVRLAAPAQDPQQPCSLGAAMHAPLCVWLRCRPQ